MKNPNSFNFATLCIHAGQKPESTTGAVMTPIFQTSTYAQESPGVHKGYEYSRSHNPTRKALENSLSELEHGKYAFCFASGLSAISTLLLSFSPKDHIVAMEDLYGGSSRLFNQVFSRFGMEFSYTDLSIATNLEKNIKPNTKLVWVETPTNPLLKITDIKKIAQICKNNNILLAVDNTFATPALQNPLLLGADFVVHSTTKYIGGHSDVIGGTIITNNSEYAEKIGFLSNSVGAIPGPMDCFLTLRGIKTLQIRMEKHSENALFIAQKLKNHPKVEKVYFPDFEKFKDQMKGPSGMISFVVSGGLEKAKKLCEKTQIFTLAESLGGVESLIEHPAIMTHQSIKKEVRETLGIGDGLVRLSVGIEDKKDLWHDLEQALL